MDRVTTFKLLDVFVSSDLSWDYHVMYSQHLSLLHSFTPGSKPTFSTNPSHLNKLMVPPECLYGSLDWTGFITLINLFLVCTSFKFFRSFHVLLDASESHFCAILYLPPRCSFNAYKQSDYIWRVMKSYVYVCVRVCVVDTSAVYCTSNTQYRIVSYRIVS